MPEAGSGIQPGIERSRLLKRTKGNAIARQFVVTSSIQMPEAKNSIAFMT